MSRSAREYLQHMADEIAYLNGATTGITQDQFLQHETLKRAVVRSLEIIGEAVKQLPAELIAPYSHIPWRAIGRTRDRLIHHYFGVDYEIVWDIVQNHIPPLATAVRELLLQLDTTSPDASDQPTT